MSNVSHYLVILPIVCSKHIAKCNEGTMWNTIFGISISPSAMAYVALYNEVGNCVGVLSAHSDVGTSVHQF